MSMFGQMKDMYKMQKQAKAMKKKLANIHIESEADGIKITMSADQEIVSIDIADDIMAPEQKPRLVKAIMEAMKKASKKAQEVSALEMREIMGNMGLNLPGMGGQ